MAGPFDRTGRPRHDDVLTPAEWEVLACIREGMTNAEAAAARGCSVETVRFHLRNLRAKVGISPRVSLRDWPGRPAAVLEERSANTQAWSIREQIPLIAVHDMRAMLKFYRVALGMTVVSRYPENGDEPPGWCALASGAARIMLHEGHHARDVSNSVGPGRITLSLYVTGIDALRADLVARGLRPGDIAQLFYGAREFYIKDPEGNELALVEFAASDPPYVTQPTA